MLSASGREATVERFIGWLTIALGFGAIIPRPGSGLYAILERDGDRALWSILLINVGALLISFSFIPARRLRILLHLVICALWLGLIYKFVNTQLWGASLQGLTVIFFALSSARRLFNDPAIGETPHASPKNRKKTAVKKPAQH